MKKQQTNEAMAGAGASEKGAGQSLAVVETVVPERKPISTEEAFAFIEKHLLSKKLSSKDEIYLERAFRDNPGLWRAIGDISVQTENHMMERMTSQAVVMAGAKHGVANMREKLGYKNAPIMERLLIDQVVLCWLNLNWVQRGYDNNLSGSVTLTVGMYWEKRLTMAQARYTKAVETLAKVRRLARVTPLQVNIGGQQINVAGGSGVSEGASD